MKAVLTQFIFWLATYALMAQPVTFSVPDSLADDSLESCVKKSFCTPGILNKSRSRGVDIAYNIHNGGTIRPDETQYAERPGELSSLQTIILKVKIPILNKPGFKLLAGYNYIPEKYFLSTLPVSNSFSVASPNFSDVFNDIDTRRLKSNSFNLYAMKPLNEKHYLAFRFSAAFNGDYEGWVRFDNRYGVYRGAAVYGIKRSEDLEYGFGLTFSKGFRRTIALPFFFYNRNFSDKWGLETVFPAYVNGRYNFNRNTILLFGYEYSGRSYSIDVRNSYTGAESIYHLSHDEFLLGASIERKVVPWVWVNLKAGMQINLPTNFRAADGGAFNYSATPTPAPYVRMGLFISPPDKACYGKKK